MYSFVDYALFLAKTATIVIAILVIVGGIAAIIARSKVKEKGKLILTKLNKKYNETTEELNKIVLSKEQQKKLKKKKKAEKKNKLKQQNHIKPNLFILNFHGDIRASAITSLREEITGILLISNPQDEVLLRLESPGGLVNSYGLAASQLQRLRDANIKLTISIDKMAASGGYMMACVADQIVAAPFAILGSIGVVAQLPNFHRWLKKRNIDFEQLTAGEYKRTLSVFGENTDKGRKKMQEEIDDAHELFKSFISNHRPDIDLKKVATGEHWFGTQALKLKLVDKLQTSDDYLLAAKSLYEIYEVHYEYKKPLTKRLSLGVNQLTEKFLNL